MPLSESLVSEIQHQDSEDGILDLISIAHPDLPTPLRFVNDFGSGTLRALGHNWVRFECSVTLPSEPEQGPQQAQITFSNISQEVGATIRALSTSPTIAFRGVRISDPETVEYEFTGLKLKEVSIGILSVTATLARPELDREPVPADRFLPDWFPYLGRSRNE